MSQIKYIFVTGGVTSSLGKGIISASLGALLQSRGYKVSIQKLDPYFNIDSGTLNPYEHGECFVTEDGTETDLDLGHYERFLNNFTSQANSITSGGIYQTIIKKERRGEYLGKTVQVIPHVTDEIKRRVQLLGNSNQYDIIITEIGGIVGDIECLPYIESVRQLKWELGSDNSLVIHLTLLPFLDTTGELKTKPTQHSVRYLMGSGIQADFLICRSRQAVSDKLRDKLALFCNVKPGRVFESVDVQTIYDLPELLYIQGFDQAILDDLNLCSKSPPDLSIWRDFLRKYKNSKKEVSIAIVGKYTNLHDAYKSINEALIHAGACNEVRVNIRWIYSGGINNNNRDKYFKDISGIIVAPGFGKRGIKGKILAIEFARVYQIPFLGICLGMQMAAIEFARNILDIKAQSTEMYPNTKYPVIDLMQTQKTLTQKGGTMRLGAWDCRIKKDSLLWQIYAKEYISERHRHRYEFNSDYLEVFTKAGMDFPGDNPETGLIEAMELKNHPFFLGVQYHPEYKSTVAIPHPLFIHFIKASKAFLSK